MLLILSKNVKNSFNKNASRCCVTFIRKFSDEFQKAECNKSPLWSKFKRASHGEWFQMPPKLQDPFLTDEYLLQLLKRFVPHEERNEISLDLEKFGKRIVNEIDDLGWECEVNPPFLNSYDVFGRRVDKLVTCDAWKKQHDISAEEGLISIAYERKLNIWSRLHQILKNYLYGPSAGLYGCPLAMTDGAAKTLLELKNTFSEEQKALFMKAFHNLTTRNALEFWTSGQWMTEKKGGSDVAQSTETIAVPCGSYYKLYGYKWFSSATDANMALTLARIAKNSEVSDKLTMFYVETRNSEGNLNEMQMVRLKNKLGTRQLPTAELLLDGTVAYRLSQEGRGIASISHMLNITRLHNSVSSVGGIRRMLMLSRAYSHVRVAFGRKLAENPLHLRVLSSMETEVRGSLLLLFQVALLLGKEEMGVISADDKLLLRILMPLMKLYTAKQAVAMASEGLETFGGLGYLEDSRLPAMLRDAQALPIWEGTTNVMSLDVLRSMLKSHFEVLSSLHKSVVLCCEMGEEINGLKVSCDKVKKGIDFTVSFLRNKPELMEIAARDVAFSMARCYIGALLVEHAAVTKRTEDIFTANQWCLIKELCPLSLHDDYRDYQYFDYKTVMNGYVKV